MVRPHVPEQALGRQAVSALCESGVCAGGKAVGARVRGRCVCGILTCPTRPLLSPRSTTILSRLFGRTISSCEREARTVRTSSERVTSYSPLEWTFWVGGERVQGGDGYRLRGRGEGGRG